MKLIEPKYVVLSRLNGSDILANIERAGRTCYKSEDKITSKSAVDFVKMIIKRGHESVLEHEKITVLFISNRGYSHEQVRHRIASYSQESTRFVNYSTDKQDNEIKCVNLENSLKTYGKNLKEKGREWTSGEIVDILDVFSEAWACAEAYYMKLTGMGVEPQFARNVLPIGVKTEIVVTANLREWREVFRQRTADVAHPQMKELMRHLLGYLKENIPIVFDDINY